MHMHAGHLEVISRDDVGYLVDAPRTRDPRHCSAYDGTSEVVKLRRVDGALIS